MMGVNEVRAVRQTHVALAHYTCKDDISGVTTWLQTILPPLSKSFKTSLLLHHFPGAPPDTYLESDLAAALKGAEIRLDGTNRVSRSEAAVRQVLQFINKTRPSCFFPHCLPEFYFAAHWLGAQGLPWAFTFHSDDPEYWALAESIQPQSNCATWVTVSEYLAEKLASKFPNANIRIIPYGVRVPDTRASWNPDRFRVVFSGRLVEPQKRVSLVIDALVQACRQLPSIEGRIIGDGIERAALERRIASEGLDRRITFAGRLTPEQVNTELAAAQAILMLSDFEGLPLALLEAMSIGVVPIARRIPSGIPELVRDRLTGLLVDDVPKNAALAIASLAQNPSLWNECAANSRMLICNKYSQDICVSKWRELIEELSSRSTITYPIQIPKHIPLPPLNPSLARLDRRRRIDIQRLPTKLRQSAGRILGKLTFRLLDVRMTQKRSGPPLS
jgi:glycosyltransferase involved in cell wall biosynthesis